MKTSRLWILSCAGLIGLLTQTANAEGWSMSKLNPFAKDGSAKPKTSRVSDSDSKSWSLPKLPSWSSTKPAPAARKSEPSTIGKVTSGTKSMLSKTKETLTPWDDSPSKSKKRSPSSRTASSRQPKKSKGFLPSSWFADSKPSKSSEPRSVTDFIGQQRVGED